MQRNNEMGMQMPNLESLRNEALFAGALDPMTLRFQIVEYDKFSGELLSIPGGDLGFVPESALNQSDPSLKKAVLALKPGETSGVISE